MSRSAPPPGAPCKIGVTTGLLYGGCKVTVTGVVEIIIIVVAIYVAVRMFRKRG